MVGHQRTKRFVSGGWLCMPAPQLEVQRLGTERRNGDPRSWVWCYNPHCWWSEYLVISQDWKYIKNSREELIQHLVDALFILPKIFTEDFVCQGYCFYASSKPMASGLIVSLKGWMSLLIAGALSTANWLIAVSWINRWISEDWWHYFIRDDESFCRKCYCCFCWTAFEIPYSRWC